MTRVQGWLCPPAQDRHPRDQQQCHQPICGIFLYPWGRLQEFQLWRMQEKEKQKDQQNPMGD